MKIVERICYLYSLGWKNVNNVGDKVRPDPGDEPSRSARSCPGFAKMISDASAYGKNASISCSGAISCHLPKEQSPASSFSWQVSG